MQNPSKRILFAFTILTSILLSPPARAYDVDTHFYATYSMARYAGIRHEVAARIALGAQWMDESYVSDPTSMILMPLTGVKKRRLLHFPSSRGLGAMQASTQIRILGFDQLTFLETWAGAMLTKYAQYEGRLSELALSTETVEDHEFGSELFMEGLKAGHLMMASAGLHVLEDSFAHAGTPAEEGHVRTWHWPDRPFASPAKYLRMVNAVFKALVAIRTQLPPDAVDCSVRIAPIPESIPNCEMDAERLGANYGRTAAIVDAMSANTLRHPDYIATVVRDFFERATKAKYVKISPEKVEQIVDSLARDGKMDAHQTIEMIVGSIIRSQIKNGIDVIDIGFVLSDLGRMKKNATGPEVIKYIGQYGKGSPSSNTPDPVGIAVVVKSMTYELLRWNVPVPISDTHQKETEDDKSPIRAKEIELRVDAQRELIRQLYGIDINFVYNETKDAVGFAREIEMNPAAEPKIPKTPGVYYATYSLKEKNAFNHMVFHYLFPSLEKQDLELFVRKFAPLVRAAKEGEKWKAAGKLAAAVYSLERYIPSIFKDLAERRITPEPDDFYYRNPTYFEEYRRNGIVKPLLGATDLYRLDELTRESQEQLRAAVRP